MSVRVRFAPSPTGPLHIGGVRTALYNYLFAKKMGGKFILRLEDTDQTRFVAGASEYIQEALSWLGLDPDEGAGIGGELGPYVQSERKHLYDRHIQILVDRGNAYYAFDTPEELDQMRKDLEAANSGILSYGPTTRMNMANSLTLSEEEVQKRMIRGDQYVIRLKVPENEEVIFTDIIRGEVVVNSSEIDDKVLIKSDGYPTYHLANIVDDHLMEITHVIRGEEWLPSAPLHILLYRAFGWEPPQFAHLPLILKPEGNGKLSKRDGVLGDFPVFPLLWEDPENEETSRGFREDGYYPEAVINFLALLGWNPGTEQEIISMDELIKLFDINTIHKSGARFDVAKAKWFNQQYLRAKSDEELAEELNKEINDSAMAQNIVRLMKNRVDFVHEMTEGIDFLFNAPTTYDEAVASKRWNDQAKAAMPIVVEGLKGLKEFTSETIHDAVWSGLEANDIKPGRVMQALRLAVTGEGRGPDLMLIIEIIGKEEAVKRIENALNALA